ncbi:MAG: type II toxin-antitoxin system RelE/ParE family toxin [Chromatiales bacterium]|nr:MAG: type II toxin-antitoxin system RelE/ParE family toxin [Chromatiales bacterium]
MKYRLDDEASDEFINAVQHYARMDRRLGRRFIEDLRRSLSLLRDNPYLGPRVIGDNRRLLLKRFPYLVIYRVDTASRLIHILAIVDQRRRPDAWRTRVEEPPAAYEALGWAA